MRFGSLFSGIGGFDLGLERAGMSCKWQVEIDPFCRKVLAKHWPDVPKHDDVKTFPPTQPEDWSVDLIAGGFPCQDISKAANVIDREYAGIDGARSGLWGSFERIIREIRPRYVLVENVAKMLDGGLGRVLGDLAAIGFDAEWACVPASSVGAPHIRDRLFVFAHAHGERFRGGRRSAFACPPRRVQDAAQEWSGLRLDVRSMGERSALRARLIDDRVRQPDALRVGYGVSRGMDGYGPRRKGLGNAVVPQVAEWIGRRIMEAHNV